MTIKAVIFDMDGVLLDSLAAHLEFCREVAPKREGIEIPVCAEEFKRKHTWAGKKVSPMSEFFRVLGFNDEEIEVANEHYKRDFHKRDIALFVGVEDMLTRLTCRGLKIGVVTSNVRNVVEKSLKEVLDCFNGCIFADDDKDESGNRRTKTAAINAAMKQLEVGCHETVFVGDQVSDYRAAQESGARFLGVSYGWGFRKYDKRFTTVEDRAELASCILNSIREDLHKAVDRAQNAFNYHASQRHTSINFYLVALGIVGAGYSSVISGDSPHASSIGVVLGLAVVVISICFLLLDNRNEMLVMSNERLMRALEKPLALHYEVPEFETIVDSNFRKPLWLRYGTVMPFMFLFFAALGLFGVAFSLFAA